MFEEATLYRRSEIPIPLIDQADTNSRSLKLSAFETVRYWHQRHHIWIRQWLATGTVKSEQAAGDKRWVLYSEYQNRQGNNAYLQKSFSSLESALAYSESDILTMQFPNF